MKSAHKDLENSPGQIVNPVGQVYERAQVVLDRTQTIGGIIDRVRKTEPLNSTDEVYQRGYAEGFVDGKNQGFREGIAWFTGKS